MTCSEEMSKRRLMALPLFQTLRTQLRASFEGRSRFVATLRNFFWLSAERILALGVALLVTLPMARYLGTTRFGTLSHALAIAGLVGPLAQLGLADLVTKTLREQPEREGAILGTVALLRKTGALVGTTIVGLWALLARGGENDVLFYAVIICSAYFIGNYNFLQFWFVSKNDVRPFTTSQVITLTAMAIARIGLIVARAPLEAFVAVSVAELLVQGALCIITYRRHRAATKNWEVDWLLARELMKKAWPLALGVVSSAVYFKLDIVMIGQIQGDARAGVYAVAARLSEIWYFLPVLLTQAMLPSLIELKDSSREGYRAALQNTLDLLAAASTMLALAISLLAGPIVYLLFGSAYAAAAPILAIHIWASVFMFLRSVSAKWMLVEDMYSYVLMMHAAGAVSNILLNLYLIPRFGGMGAAWATLISYATVSMLCLAFTQRTRPMFVMQLKAIFWIRRMTIVGVLLKRCYARNERK